MKGRYQLNGPIQKQAAGKGLISIFNDATIMMDCMINHPEDFGDLLLQAEELYGKHKVWKLLTQPAIGIEEHCDRNLKSIMPKMSMIQFAAWSGNFYHHISEDGLTDGVNPQDPDMGNTYFLNKMFAYIPDKHRHLAISQLENLRDVCRFIPLLNLMQGYSSLGTKLTTASKLTGTTCSLIRSAAIAATAKIQKSMPLNILSYMCEPSDSLADLNNRRAPNRTPKVVCNIQDVEATADSSIEKLYRDKAIEDTEPRYRKELSDLVTADIKSVMHNLGRKMITRGYNVCNLGSPTDPDEAKLYFDMAKKLFDTKVEMYAAFLAYQQKLDNEYRGTCEVKLR